MVIVFLDSEKRGGPMSNQPLIPEIVLETGNAPRSESFKDELNFAEFPLASLSDWVPEDQKTLEFHDTIFDQSIGKNITRKLTIAASDKYGLPRALDEEVILGLVQLTNRQLFRDKRVYFSSYELIKLLGWADSAKSYKRIEESLRRWVSITLFYDKAWWSKEDQCWVNENFHILESVTIYDKERRAARAKQHPNDKNATRSHFVWNDIVFRSFQAGNLKEIDLDIYRELRSAIAKRMYRFLDKHFYRRAHLEYDLHRFAHEHIGIARTVATGEVKRLLLKAILELEAIGFLVSCAKEERFIKIARGQWKVVFDRGGAEARALLSAEQEQLLNELKTRGVTGAKASKLVRTFAPERVAEKLAIHDWLMARGDKRCANNPPGFLVAAIKDDYPLPAGFLKSREQAKSELRVIGTVSESQRVVEPGKAPKSPQEELEEKLEGEFDSYWAASSEDERQLFEVSALNNSPEFTQKFYRERKEGGGALFHSLRRKILVAEFQKRSKSL